MTILSELIPDTLDPRDYIFTPDDGDKLFESPSNVQLPYRVDLRNFIEREAEAQGHIGSCTAAATIHAAEMFDPTNDLSILFNYYVSRDIQGRLPNEGSSAREALRAAKHYGLCLDHLWPLDETKVNERPPDLAYANALYRKIGAYFRIQTELNQPNEKIIQTIKYALAKGWPVLVAANIGVFIHTLIPGQVYQPLSAPGNAYIGAHEWLVVGYEKDGSFICKNSWGKDWCDNGYFLCHPNVMDTDTFDCWVMKGFNGCSTVGPNQIVYIEKPSQEEIAHNIIYAGLSPQEVVDYAVFYRLSAFEIEMACDWEPGIIRKSALNELYELDWRGMIW